MVSGARSEAGKAAVGAGPEDQWPLGLPPFLKPFSQAWGVGEGRAGLDGGCLRCTEQVPTSPEWLEEAPRSGPWRREGHLPQLLVPMPTRPPHALTALRPQTWPAVFILHPLPGGREALPPRPVLVTLDTAV